MAFIKGLCAVKNIAQGLSLSKITSLVLNAVTTVTDTENQTEIFLEKFIDFFGEIFNSWIYILSKYVLWFIDLCQVIAYKIAGIDNNFEDVLQMPILKFLLNKTVLKIFGTTCVIGLILLIVFTILAIITNEYKSATTEDKDPKPVAYKILGKSVISLILMVITPFIVVVVIIFSSVLMTSINNVLNPNGSQYTTIGGMVFTSSAYNANKYRIYASNGKRIPILIDFDDPYNNGTYVYYTSEELADIYNSFEDGESLYTKFSSNGFDSFDQTLTYKNGRLYNSNDYWGFENFVTTAEQYYVMADFIDYAMKHDIKFYIKNSNDELIDWDRLSSSIKITDNVYDPVANTLTMTYVDASNLVEYQDTYTVTFSLSSASASSPLMDASKTLSLILGLDLNTKSGSNIVSQTKNSSLTALTSLGNDLFEQVAKTSSNVNNAVDFRILERVEGSTNVVRWQTEKAIYNKNEFTVYELKKIVKNEITGINETLATVKVAKRDYMLDSTYYVVSETPNDYGYYEYTNIKIDYYNDGVSSLDTLTPLYKRVSWPYKLYNDLSIIYSDIDFDNYINYDNWADALGSYFKTNSNVLRDDVSSFSTTLIHPLGLIMAELFLGVTIDDENKMLTDFGFTSAYVEDITNALVMSISGEENFDSVSTQIKSFVSMFNAQFTEVIQNLQELEGFDVFDSDPLSVQNYVYKSYLASIMLSKDYSEYMYQIANFLATSQRLYNLISYGSDYVIVNSDGQVEYVYEKITDESGDYIPLLNDDGSSKFVYNYKGEKCCTCDEYGVLSLKGEYVPASLSSVYIDKKNDGAEKVVNAYFNNDGSQISKDSLVNYYEDNNDVVYVYEPKDGNTASDKTPVELIEYCSSSETDDLEDYFLYETEKTTLTSSKFLTYNELTTNYQDFIKTLIENVQKEVASNKIEEPEYLEFLIEYQNNGVEMQDVMSAKLITQSKAEKIYKKRKSLTEDLETLKEKLNSSTGFKHKILTRKYNETYQKLCQMKKFYIIYGIQSCVSSTISADFSVVVNSHLYNVSQGMPQRQFMETILGNKYTGTTLINSIANGTSYNKLSNFDKLLMDDLRGFFWAYKQEIESILDKKALFGGSLTDSELELVSNIYTATTSLSKSFTNKSLKNYTNDEKIKLQNILRNFSGSIMQIYSNYRDGLELTSFVSTINSPDIAKNYLTIMTEYTLNQDKLMFFDESYVGILDDNNDCYGDLKEFLSDFGNLCFNISTRTNLDELVNESNINILDEQYIIQFINQINNYLKEIDFGSTSDSVEVFDGSNLKEANGSIVSSNTIFKNLSPKSKDCILSLLDLYRLKKLDYEEKLKFYSDVNNYSYRFIDGLYAMFSNSYIYETALPEYLEYFRYNCDVSLDASKFRDRYVYSSYTGSLNEVEDRITYYNLYLQAFNNVVFGNKGLYFDNLSNIQQKVIKDLSDYAFNQYNIFQSTYQNIYNEDCLIYDCLYKFVVGEMNWGGDEVENELNLVSAVSLPINQIVQTNINYLNFQRLLDFVGLDFSVTKTWNDYRIEALNSMINFKERAGESGVSIQSRYLALMCIFNSSFELMDNTDFVLTMNEGTEQVLLKLAGLENSAKENLINVSYSRKRSNAVADEKNGDIFIVCTYNEESKLFEPFIFASGSNKNGIPYSDYYASNDSEVSYYPIIAKGVIDPSGNPTAIREVNGFIEFYRDNVVIVDTVALNLEMYYASKEDISRSYNFVNSIINFWSSVLTGKSLADRIVDSIPMIIDASNYNFAYGVSTDEVYHLDGGGFILNYMFYSNTGINMNLLYSASDLNILILMFGTILLSVTMIKLLYGLISILYQIVLLVLIYPGALALNPIKDGPIGTWRKNFINNVLASVVYIISINGYFIILTLLDRLDIVFILDGESVEYLKSTYVFGNFNMSAILSILMTFVMYLVASTLFASLPKLFKSLTDANDVLSKGEDAKTQSERHLEDFSYFASGYGVEDVMLSKIDAIKDSPILGNPRSSINANKDKAQADKNKKLVDAYKTRLKGMGIKDETIAKATKAYADSLNRKAEAERQRRDKNLESRNARLSVWKNREKARRDAMEKAAKKKKEPKECPNCSALNDPKAKNCRRCGEPLK